MIRLNLLSLDIMALELTLVTLTFSPTMWVKQPTSASQSLVSATEQGSLVRRQAVVQQKVKEVSARVGGNQDLGRVKKGWKG